MESWFKRVSWGTIVSTPSGVKARQPEMFKLTRELRRLERTSREESVRSGHSERLSVSNCLHDLMIGMRYSSVIPVHLLMSKCLSVDGRVKLELTEILRIERY